MHFLLEVVLVAAALFCARALLRAGFRTYGDGHPLWRGLLALVAWVPVWVLTYKLWLPATGHRSHIYTNRWNWLTDGDLSDISWWFAILFWLAFLLMLLSLVKTLHGLVRGVRFIGFVLVVIAFFQVGYFAPSDDATQALHAFGKNIQSQLDKTNNDVMALRGSLESSDTAQKAIDTAQNARLDKLEKAVADLQKHDASQDKAIAALKGNIAQIKTTGVNMTPSPSDLTTPEVAASLAKALSEAGSKIGDVRVGTVDWSANPYEAGSRAFSDQMTTRQELSSYENSSAPSAAAARQHLQEALAAKHLPASEMQRLLSGEGFVPVQFLKEICYSGNGYFLNGIFKRDGTTCRAAGDIVWVYVASNGDVVWDASVRADCANPGFLTPPAPRSHPPITTPTTRSTPSSTTSTTPSTPPTKTHTTTPGCGPAAGVLPKDWDFKKCQKKVVTRDCASHPTTAGCPANGGFQSGDHNPGQSTGTSSGAPSTPTSGQSATSAPAGGSTGPGGSTTGGTQATTTPTTGVTGTPTGNVTPPSGG